MFSRFFKEAGYLLTASLTAFLSVSAHAQFQRTIPFEQVRGPLSSQCSYQLRVGRGLFISPISMQTLVEVNDSEILRTCTHMKFMGEDLAHYFVEKSSEFGSIDESSARITIQFCDKTDPTFAGYISAHVFKDGVLIGDISDGISPEKLTGLIGLRKDCGAATVKKQSR